jgi:hypothetical protein
MNHPTDRIHVLTDRPSEHAAAPIPFIPQTPTVRPLTERPITREDIKEYLATVKRTNRMIEAALEKLLTG